MQDCRAPLALVADVGGTNSRLGLARAGAVLGDSIQRFANDEFASFTTLARHFLAGRSVSALAVAIAGPVSATAGRLTNRDWMFDVAALRGELGIGQVHLLNDLAALGLALPALPPQAVEVLRAASVTPGKNRQALVVGLGTGFNVSLVSMTTGAVFEAEMGHASLPAPVMSLLSRSVEPAAFTTVERLFSGTGLQRLHVALGHPDARPADIAASDAETVELMTAALGLFVRELAYCYLPDAGFFFNGSLARTLLRPRHRETAFGPLAADAAFDGRIARIPAFLVTEDSAALHGCARVLSDRILDGSEV